MKSLASLIAIVAGLVIVLTYFLVQGTGADRPRERAGAIQAVILHDAALQRAVLLARAGLLPNYDPLVRSMEDLLAAAEALPATAEIATGEARTDIERKIGAAVQAIREQERLVETFKSENALLRNSLSYFNHLSGMLASGAEGDEAEVEAETDALTNAMLRFINAPRQNTTERVLASLDRLGRLADDPTVRSLVIHGRLVAETLPRVDEAVARIQAAPVSRLARALQEAYAQAQARAARRADTFMILIYAAALALLIYIAFLFLRLRANAKALRTRLEFERLIASISTQFVNLPRSELRSAVDKGLAKLADHASAEGARIIIFRGTKADSEASFSYSREEGNIPLSPEQTLELIRYWTAEGYESQGCLYIPDVETLPAGQEKAVLRSAGIRTLVCIPMRIAGRCLGVLSLHHAAPRHWREHDISLMRTAAEILASAIARDASEAEREELEARLNRSQRLEAIGTLAGGIAHEFNNVLGAVRGYSEMALSVLKEARARRHVMQIMKAGERAQDIVEQILAFGRRQDREHRPLAAEAVVAEAVNLVRVSLPSTVSLRVRMKAQGSMIMGDATELQQIVMNLCTNAAQAMEGHGMLRIVLDTVAARQTLHLSHGSLSKGRYVRVLVQDSGHGIDPDTMERIFEPFFTTKPAGQGTGLGLSTVHGIVSAHRGAIDVKSRPGKGTSFTVYFPAIDAEALQETDEETPVRSGRGETVLIVDDDARLVALGEEMLAALGYEPVGFDGSRAAMAAFHANPARFDLVLTDEVMPEMTGTELAGAIHQKRPDLPVILMTGYDHDPRPDLLQKAGIREVLKKPLLSQQLAECLSRQLGSNAPVSAVTNSSFSEIKE